MNLNCLNCGEPVVLTKYSFKWFDDRLCPDVFQKTERTKYQGRCFRCGAEFCITMERHSIISGPKKEGL